MHVSVLYTFIGYTDIRALTSSIGSALLPTAFFTTLGFVGWLRFKDLPQLRVNFKDITSTVRLTTDTV